MKGILIISSLPDIIFIHADKGFIKHVNKLSHDAGFIDKDHNDAEMDMSALSQLFSPMITSLTYMSDLGNPYSSILCEDGTLFVFQQVCMANYYAVQYKCKVEVAGHCFTITETTQTFTKIYC